MTANAELRKSSLAVESLLFAGRLLTHWRREPVMAIQALLYPTFLLIAYDLLEQDGTDFRDLPLSQRRGHLQ